MIYTLEQGTLVRNADPLKKCLHDCDLIVCLGETESEKSIGVDLGVDDDVVIGQDFFVRATITNKTDTKRLVCPSFLLFIIMKAPRVLMSRWRCQSYIKLLIASFYTHTCKVIDYNYHDEHF